LRKVLCDEELKLEYIKEMIRQEMIQNMLERESGEGKKN
jgi:hypothetical protein